MIRTLVFAVALAGCSTTVSTIPDSGTDAMAPNPQLALGVTEGLSRYGIDTHPEALTLAQASALHLLLNSGYDYLETRRRARAILAGE